MISKRWDLGEKSDDEDSEADALAQFQADQNPRRSLAKGGPAVKERSSAQKNPASRTTR
jgi:hypothetical protein